MYGFIAILSILVCIILMLVVLVQNPKGGGLSSAFGGSGGGGGQILGAKRTTDFLEKATWFLAIALIVLSLGSNFFINRGGDSGSGDLTIEESISNSSQIYRDKLNTNSTTTIDQGSGDPVTP